MYSDKQHIEVSLYVKKVETNIFMIFHFKALWQLNINLVAMVAYSFVKAKIKPISSETSMDYVTHNR